MPSHVRCRPAYDRFPEVISRRIPNHPQRRFGARHEQVDPAVQDALGQAIAACNVRSELAHLRPLIIEKVLIVQYRIQTIVGLQPAGIRVVGREICDEIFLQLAVRKCPLPCRSGSADRFKERTETLQFGFGAE